VIRAPYRNSRTFLRSRHHIETRKLPLGMQTDNVLLARFVLGRQRYVSDPQQLAFFNELERRVSAAPGVQAMALADSIPPSGGMVGLALRYARIFRGLGHPHLTWTSLRRTRPRPLQRSWPS
jgi:hypothetical protein